MKFIYALLFFTCLNLTATAQIRIEVVKHADLLLPDGDLYITGTFNDWHPGNAAYILKRKAGDIFYIDLPDTLTYFKYKFTQGNWNSVEGNTEGGMRAEAMPLKVVYKDPDNPQKLFDEPLLIQMKEKIEVYMEKSKPFTNPNLTLNELANKVKIQRRLIGLSKK